MGRTIWTNQGSLGLIDVPSMEEIDQNEKATRSMTTGADFRKWMAGWSHRANAIHGPNQDQFCCQAIVKDLFVKNGFEKFVGTKLGRNMCAPISLIPACGNATKGLPENQLLNNQMWSESTNKWKTIGDFAVKHKYFGRAGNFEHSHADENWDWQFMVRRNGLQNKWSKKRPSTLKPWVVEILDRFVVQKPVQIPDVQTPTEVTVTQYDVVASESDSDSSEVVEEPSQEEEVSAEESEEETVEETVCDVEEVVASNSGYLALYAVAMLVAALVLVMMRFSTSTEEAVEDEADVENPVANKSVIVEEEDCSI